MYKKRFEGKEVIIMTCSNCNTNCKHCYISYEGNFDGKQLYDLCSKLMDNYRVLLNGTEILLHPEFFPVLELVGQNFLLTNGLELERNPKIIKMIADVGIKYVGTSYHFGIHSDISSVGQTLIERNISRLREYGIGTDLRVTLTSKNYHLVKKMCEKAVSLKATGIKFTNYMQMGAALDLEEDNILSDEQIMEFFKLFEETRNIYPKDKLLIRRCGSFGKNCFNCNRKFSCTAGRESVVIAPDLNVYPCFFLAKKRMKIGYVEDGEIIIDNPIEHDSDKCLAREINNNGYKPR